MRPLSRRRRPPCRTHCSICRLRARRGCCSTSWAGPDLTLGEVHQVAEIIKDAASADANVIFGVVQDKKMKRKVSLTLVGTGIQRPGIRQIPVVGDDAPLAVTGASPVGASVNGHAQVPVMNMKPLL